MKKNLFFIFALISSISFSQVGINTKNPQKSLHVNGSLQITNELNVGGDASSAGNSGTKGQILISNGSNTAPTWSDLESNGISIIVGLFGFLDSGNDTTFLSDDLGGDNNIRQIKWDNIKTSSKYITYDKSDNSFTANATGFYTFSINLVIVGPYTGIMRVGLTRPYTGTLTFADNYTFSFLSQPYVNSTSSNFPITLYSNGTIYLEKGQKVTTLTRYITPTINTLNVESINYNRTLVNSLTISFFTDNSTTNP